MPAKENPMQQPTAQSAPADTVLIPLDLLHEDPLNARKTPVPEDRIQRLAEDIAKTGVLQNLLVTQDPDAPEDAQRFLVTAGDSRLQALRTLSAANRIPPDFRVPCQVNPNADPAHRITVSLAENELRTEMTPLEQAEAFAEMNRAGQTIEQIATRTGRTEHTVRQRIAIGHVHPEIRDACRNGQIPLSFVKAYAMCADTDRQLSIHRDHRPHSLHALRSLLNDDPIDESHSLFQWVGHEAYESAGGTYIEDLFTVAEEHWNGRTISDTLEDEAPQGNPRLLADQELFGNIASAKLEAIARKLAKDWKWTESSIHAVYEYHLPNGYTVLQPLPTPARKAALEEARKRHDEAHSAWMQLLHSGDEEALDKASSNRTAAWKAAQEAARKATKSARFPKEIREISGCMVFFDGRKHSVLKGIVTADDRTLIRSLPKHMQPQTSSATRAKSTRPASSLPYSKPLTLQLSEHRAHIIRNHIASAPDAAFDFAAFNICRNAFAANDANRRGTPLTLDIRTQANNEIDELLRAFPDDQIAWIDEADNRAAFTAFTALPEGVRKSLLGIAASIALPPNLSCYGTDGSFEATVDRLGIDFAASMRPTADNYWNSIPKSRCLEIATEVFGADFVSSKALAKLRKADLAQTLETLFEADSPEPAGRSWAIPEFLPKSD